MTQTVYFKIFEVFMTFYSLFHGTGQVAQFWKQAFIGIFKSLPSLILIALPFVLYIIMLKKKVPLLEKTGLQKKLVALLSAFAFYLVSLCLVVAGSHDALSAYDVYFNENVLETAANRFGLFTACRLDFEDLLFKRFEFSTPPEPDDPISEFSKPSESSASEISESSEPSENTEASEPSENSESSESSESSENSEPETIVYGDNVMDIDFDAVAKKYAKNKTITALTSYFSSQPTTKKNKYTGMFKDCNLIFIVAESFSSYIVDEERTPTLYKMANNGFVFKNFYTGLWGVSTSDGEYVACQGLIPKSGVWSMYQSGLNKNYLPFTLGNEFRSIGVVPRAYHNHTYTYYKRHISHPNMGYEYIGKGNGLDVRGTWPESDLEMMQLTVPVYINEERFHTYYLTVSGHMNYSWIGNYMSSKNKSTVIDLPYCEEVLAYYACNMELEYAMTYLLEQLEAAGIAENTVIVLSADHYPYGMEKSSIDEMAGHEVDENFEIYETTLIIYKAGMDPIIVEKPCSSIDILPTVLNLFGFEYDSRLLSGKDILSDSEGLVFFSNRNFITEKGRYIASTKEIIGDLSTEEVQSLNKAINNKFYYAARLLENDYYGILFGKKN